MPDFMHVIALSAGEGTTYASPYSVHCSITSAQSGQMKEENCKAEGVEGDGNGTDGSSDGEHT